MNSLIRFDNFNLDFVREAEKRIRPHTAPTPLMTSRLLNEKSGNNIFLKCENFQRGGAFKFRGAFNKISSLSADERKRGVIAFSSGNHAQGVALASKILNVNSTIVMPIGAPQIKYRATKFYGADVILYDPQKEDREIIAKEKVEKYGYVLVPPYNDYQIIAGQGTLSLELVSQLKGMKLDYLFVPVGGGGLISGNSFVLKSYFSKIKVIGVETVPANDAYQTFRKKKIIKISIPETICDGIRTQSVGEIPFQFIQKYVDDIILVEDEEVVRSMLFLLSRLKILVEPTGAVSLAAVLKNEYRVKGKNIGVILSGGNIDLTLLADLIKRYPLEDHE